MDTKTRKTIIDRLFAIRSRRALTKLQAALLITVIVVCAFSGCYYYFFMRPAPSTIVLACALPLTGSMASSGIDCKQGTELAVQDINAAGGIKNLGGAKIEVIYGDVQSNPTVCSSETQSLITTYHPVAMMGAYSSALTLVAAQVTDRNKVPLLAPMSQVDSLTQQGYQYVFRQAITAVKCGARAVDMIASLSQHDNVTVKNVAFVYDNSAIGQEISSSAIAEAKALNYTIDFNQMFIANSPDYSSLVTSLKAVNPAPDVIFVLAYIADATLLTQEFQQYQVYAKAIVGMAGAGFLEPSLITTVGNASEYIFAGNGFAPDLNIPGLADVTARYQQEFNVFMNEHAGLSYTATWLLADVINLSAQLHPSDPLTADSIRDAFMKINVTTGPAAMNAEGGANFTANGDNVYGTQDYLQILNGTQYTVWPFNVASTQAVFPAPPWNQR